MLGSKSPREVLKGMAFAYYNTRYPVWVIVIAEKTTLV